MILYGNTIESDGRHVQYGSVEFAEGATNLFITGFGHIELSHNETKRLAAELTELLANW